MPLSLIALLGFLLFTNIYIDPAQSASSPQTERRSRRLRRAITSTPSISNRVDKVHTRRALQRHAQQLLLRCPLPGYCLRPTSLPTSQHYLLKPGHEQMVQQKQQVSDFVSGEGLEARRKRLRQLPDVKGILISAGKPHHVGNLAVMLYALRRQLQCALPVEVAYAGDGEVDNTTRSTLSAAFPPLHWLDLASKDIKDGYPGHQRGKYTMDRYEQKVFALYNTRFQQVLLLDADNMPLQDPSYLFDSPHMLYHGNMFWKDLWSPLWSSTTFVGQPSVWKLVGLAKEAYWEVMAGGQGLRAQRMAESGQLLLDRVRHADVLEYLWWLTSFSDVLYWHVLGDKDTFGFAFAAASKLHEMAFVAVPPGAAFRHQAAGESKEPHDENNVTPTWRFQAMLQYDHLGNAAFFHRTFMKWNDVRTLPPPMHVLSGPLPNRFIMSYLGNKTSRFTPDIPEHTLVPVRLSCPAPRIRYLNPSSGYTNAHALEFLHQQCPVNLLLELLQIKDFGLPITSSRSMRMSKLCKKSLVALHRMGYMTVANLKLDSDHNSSSSSDGGDEVEATYTAKQRLRHERQANEKIAGGSSSTGWRQLVAADGAGPAGSNDAIASNGTIASNAVFWPHLHELVWFRNCKALQARDQARRSLQNHANDVSRAAISSPAVINSTGRRRQQTTERDLTEASIETSSETTSVPAAMLAVNCSAVAWHVMRYMLPEYAEDVARNAAQAPVADVDPRLPVLLLNSLFPVGLGSKPTAQGFTVNDKECERLGMGCALDALQLRVLPAAVQWVNEHLEQLPLLKVQKEN